MEINKILQYFSRKRDIRKAKRKILEEDIDFNNVVSSAFNAKVLYDELKIVCHPDRFQEQETISKATELFQSLMENRENYKMLLQIKERVYLELPIKNDDYVL